MLTVKPRYEYGRGHRALEIVSILLFAGTLIDLGIVVSRAARGPVVWLGVGAAALIGYLAADFISGVVHWAGDTVGDETLPLFGKNFVRPFRMHHLAPKDITRHDFVETNGNSCIVSAPVLLALLLFMPRAAGFWFFAGLALLFTTFFVFCTNQFHKWAHADAPPRVVRWLQRAHVILSPSHHDVHHAAPHDEYYCITTGWMNPLLGRTRFFRRCEGLIARVRPDLLHLAERGARR